jgi:hypothetical protein
MRSMLGMFVVVVVGVFVALLLYGKYQKTANNDDFGAGANQNRLRMIRSDYARAADPARTAVAEYYTNSGSWPPDNEKVGLPAPGAYKGESLKSLEVKDNKITLTFDGHSGPDGSTIVLTGEATPNLSMGIKWTCTSPNISDIKTIFPTCSYATPQ